MLLSSVFATVLALNSVDSEVINGYHYAFQPPTCDFRVVFPVRPNSIKVKGNFAKTYSAQLFLPTTFLRADCTPIALKEAPVRKAFLKSRLKRQIEELGGQYVININNQVDQNRASFSGQIILGNELITINTVMLLSGKSLLTLTTVDKEPGFSSKTSNQFFASAYPARR